MFIECMHGLWLRIRALVKRRQFDRDLAEELEFHLTMREQKLIEQGLSPREAHYALPGDPKSRSALPLRGIGARISHSMHLGELVVQ